jgi:prepilin-type N-terminal cleavage/methylation domain-containing protein
VRVPSDGVASGWEVGTMTNKRGFTLIELLVVMSIIMVLAAMLLVGINAARIAFKRAQTQAEISSVMIAIQQYDTDFGSPPPSGVDSNNDGKLSVQASGQMIYVEAWPSPWASNEHPLVACLVEDQEIKDLNGTVIRTYAGLYSKGKTKAVADSSGQHVYLMDPYGNPYRYLADGRRPDRGVSRVSKREPILWSAGLDGLEDPQNDQIDNPPVDGRVDDSKELVDDVCSWIH